jgi:hypothetical protein
LSHFKVIPDQVVSVTVAWSFLVIAPADSRADT